MSRTHKDAPERIRKRKLGIKEFDENCSLCAEGVSRTFRSGFAAIFFAHEVKELESFLAAVGEGSYEVESREVTGYLGKKDPDLRFSFNINRLIEPFSEFFDGERAIYSAARGISDNLLWTVRGRFDTESAEAKRRRAFYEDRNFDFQYFETLPTVSHKRNIFTVVTVVHEYAISAHHYHSCNESSMDRFFYYRDCHCNNCEPETAEDHKRAKEVAGKLRKAFNSGDYEAMEDTSSELRVSNGG